MVLRLGRETIRGRVLDMKSGIPIEQFEVLTTEGDSRTHSIESKEGIFELAVHPISKEGAAISIHAPGYAASTSRLFGGLSGDYDLGDVRLAKQRTLRGIVRDGKTGSPIEGVRILAILGRNPNGSSDAFMRGISYNGIDISDEEGAYRLKGIAHNVDRLWVVGPRSEFSTIHVPPDVEEFDIDLKNEGVIEGTLVRPDRTPVAGVIEIRGSAWQMPKKLKNNGSFRLAGLGPDTYTLVAETEVGSVQQRTIVLKDSERVSGFDLVVQPGWTAVGTISGLGSTESVEIVARGLDSDVRIRKRTDNGVFTLIGLPDKVTIVARASSGHMFVREFLYGNASGTRVDFHFNGESRLRGRLTSGGQPLRGMSLKIEPENSDAVMVDVITTESGSYEARRLSDGRHVIYTDTGHEFAVEITGDTTVDIEVPENTLSGIVRGERTRSPVGGGFVKLVRAGTADSEAPLEVTRRVGSDGTFLFEGLVSGDYDILVELPNAETTSTRMHISGSETVEMMVPCANTLECAYGPSHEELSLTGR